MTRTNIHFGEKRAELLSRIWDIFMKHGYEDTTLALIIKELGVSKGAFYHYFPTKEACADAAVEQFSRRCHEQVAAGLGAEGSAVERFLRLVGLCANLVRRNEAGMEDLNKPSNALFHVKLMAALTRVMAPLYAEVIEQGVAEGAFRCAYPLETARMILTLSNFYFDADLFRWESGDLSDQLAAYGQVLTAALGAAPVAFDPLFRLES